MIDTGEMLRFAAADAFRAWLQEYAGSGSGAWLAVAKKGSRATLVTYGEALEAALEHGWIDGLARRLDDDAYLQRFTPRRRHSPWSRRNCRAAEALIAAGQMAPRGLAEVARARADGRWASA